MHQQEWHVFKIVRITYTGGDVVKKELPSIAGGNVVWFIICKKTFEESPVNLEYDPAISLLGIYSRI